MTLKRSDLPDTIDELTLEHVDILMDACRIAASHERYMNDPDLSLRLGWIIGMLRNEVLTRAALRN